MRFANGTIKKQRDGTHAYEDVVRYDGCIDNSFLKKNNLTTTSEPTDFIEALFPFEDNLYSTAKEERMSIKLLTKVREAGVDCFVTYF